MSLNNREIAALAWLLLVLIFIAWKSDGARLKDAFMDLLRAFLQARIQVVLLWAVLWVVLCVQILRQLHYWEASNLKTTLIWGGAFAFVSIMSANRINEDNTYFRKTLKETFNATAFVTFIAEAYTFSLFAELLLAPFVFIVGLIHVISERNPDQKSVHTLTTWILAIIILAYVLNGTYSAASNFNDFTSWDNLREFAVPIVLSVMFLPYLYVLSVVMTYEIESVRLAWIFKGNPKLHRYATVQALLKFRLNLEALRRWKRNIATFRPENREQIRASIEEVKTLIKKEASPPGVSEEAGWCPFSARHFLADEGLPTDDYHRTPVDGWWSSSRVLSIDNGTVLPDNALFFLRGDENAVKRLKLELNVFDGSKGVLSEPHFFAICNTLLRRAVGESAAKLLDQHEVPQPLDTSVGSRRVRFVREDYTHTRTRGYLLTLTIDHATEPAGYYGLIRQLT